MNSGSNRKLLELRFLSFPCAAWEPWVNKITPIATRGLNFFRGSSRKLFCPRDTIETGPGSLVPMRRMGTPPGLRRSQLKNATHQHHGSHAAHGNQKPKIKVLKFFSGSRRVRRAHRSAFSGAHGAPYFSVVLISMRRVGTMEKKSSNGMVEL